MPYRFSLLYVTYTSSLSCMVMSFTLEATKPASTPFLKRQFIFPTKKLVPNTATVKSRRHKITQHNTIFVEEQMAFTVGEATSSSSPCSSSPRLCSYHVFLSFRGEDTRKGFTDHLCASLERKGITTFRDDKDLERGQVISQELLKAIEESMFAITILSPNYANSTWCLDELQKIVECCNNNNLGLQVMPVFYGVDPSDVRHQRGSFEEAFRKHQEKFGQHSDKVERWRDALRQVAGYSGWDSKDWYVFSYH